MLALLLTMFLFVLGLSLLYFLDRDSRAGLNLHRSQQAQALAQSGIMYARTQALEYGIDAIALNLDHTYDVDVAGLEQFRIWREVDVDVGDVLHSRGMVKDSAGKVLAQRELATLPGYPPSMNLIVWDVDL